MRPRAPQPSKATPLAERRQLSFSAPGQITIDTEPLGTLTGHGVEVETVLSGISTGTERSLYLGDTPSFHRKWNSRRRLFVPGEGKQYPVRPGYETIGRITALGDLIDSHALGISVGDLVFLDAPHADRHTITIGSVFGGKLPDEASPEQAVFYILARVALGGVMDADIALGETVVVVGLGVIGLIAAQQARLAGAHVIGIDRFPVRLDAAKALGIDTIDASQTDPAEVVRDHTDGHGADAAIEATGNTRGLHEAIRSLRQHGRVATISTYTGEAEGLRLGEEFHRNRVTIISSMTVNDCRQRRENWTLDRLNRCARDQITTGAVQVDQLITHRIPFEHAPDAYDLITNRPDETIKVVLTHDN